MVSLQFFTSENIPLLITYTTTNNTNNSIINHPSFPSIRLTTLQIIDTLLRYPNAINSFLSVSYTDRNDHSLLSCILNLLSNLLSSSSQNNLNYITSFSSSQPSLSKEEYYTSFIPLVEVIASILSSLCLLSNINQKMQLLYNGIINILVRAIIFILNMEFSFIRDELIAEDDNSNSKHTSYHCIV